MREAMFLEDKADFQNFGDIFSSASYAQYSVLTWVKARADGYLSAKLLDPACKGLWMPSHMGTLQDRYDHTLIGPESTRVVS